MRDMPELKVEEAAVADLAPYARNAKVHTREQVVQIAKSIEEFGFNDPVAVWDGPDGTEIVEGHGRVMAAKKLGLKRVPVVRLDHLTDEQRRAYTHIHNQLAMNTGWDFEPLTLDLGELDFDFNGFGFSIADRASGAAGVERTAPVCDEIDLACFDGFAHKCPRCGFEFDG